MPKLAVALGVRTSAEIVPLYPTKQRKVIEEILSDIGLGNLGFKEVRATSPFWGAKYGLQPPISSSKETTVTSGSGLTASSPGAGSAPTSGSPSSYPNTIPLNSGGTSTKAVTQKAAASTDPKSVRRKLKTLAVRGAGREKIVMLRDEIKRLPLDEFPHAFLFLLRCMFELSAKAYCADHKKSGGPSVHTNNGAEKTLVVLLDDVAKHITQSGADKEKAKLLYGAMTELGKNNGVLSVTSLNQLIHNTSFSITVSDICILFGNVFPLLEEMNK